LATTSCRVVVTTHPAIGVSGSTIASEVSARYPNRAHGTRPALSEPMLVETIFQYRTLIGKCELGCGLDWDEIEQVTVIEHAFVADRGKSGRRYKRDNVEMRGVLRGDRINDRVDIVEIGPGGFICRQAPFIARGEQVEIVIDIDDKSYRFRAIGK